jgi:hypothetical protein
MYWSGGFGGMDWLDWVEELANGRSIFGSSSHLYF